MSEGSRERGREGGRGLLEARDLQTDKNHSFEHDFFRPRPRPRGRCSGYDVIMNARDGAAGWIVTQLTGPLPPLSSAQ
jgi:hypothetical protein